MLEPVTIEGVVYKITNLVNGAAYIGITVQGARVRFRHHWKDSKRVDNLLYRAMRKYGREAFSLEVLATAPSADLPRIEREMILAHNTFARDGGYNSTLGGEPTPEICDETREKMRLAARRRAADPVIRAKVSATLMGKKQTPEVIAARVARQTGRPLSQAHRDSIGAAQRGRVIPIEQRELIRQKLKGRKRSPEATAKIVAKLTGKKRDPSIGAKISAALRTPEGRMRRCAASRAMWAKRKEGACLSL
jgi:group I intron endonuclease